MDRWRFVRTNRDADAREALAALDLPLFAIWGTEDLNVDAGADAEIYRALAAPRHPMSRVVLWPEATHGLLRAGPYNWQLVEDWSPWAHARFVVQGRHAYAPGAMEAITDWITAVAAEAGAAP